MKMKKMICAAFCGLAVLTMAGCGELKPDQVNGVYKNDWPNMMKSIKSM